MAISIRSVTTNVQFTAANTWTVVTPVSTAVGDLIVMIHGNDFGALSNISAPTCTGTPTINAITNATADAGLNIGHIKAWWAVANTSGANTITFNETGALGEEKCGAVWVLAGADTTTAIDVAASTFNNTSVATCDAPTVSPTSADAFLICEVISTSGVAPASWTPPGTITEQYDQVFNAGMSFTGGNQQLSSSGATGVRTFTPISSSPYAAVSIAVLTASVATSIPWVAQRTVQLRDPGEVWWTQRDRANANLVATAANPLPSPLDVAYTAGGRYWHSYGDIAQRFTFAPYAQKDRRDTSLIATAANPLPAPLDTAWQADGRYWHLYSDFYRQPQQPFQRAYVSDPAMLVPPTTDPLTLAAGVGGDTWRRYNTPDFADRREVPPQRAYVSNPALLSTALLENELLGSADDLRRRYLEPAYYDRREVPQQRAYISNPALLSTALLENELLGGGDVSRRYLEPAYCDRREVPQQRSLVFAAIDDVSIIGTGALGAWWGEDSTAHFLYGNLRHPTDPAVLIPPTPFDPVISGWGPTWLTYNRAALYVDRREVPQQRAYLSDPSFYPTVPPTDPLTIAWGAGGPYWTLYNGPALRVDRREVPQQRAYVSDPLLLTKALLENELLGGADDRWRRYGQLFTDRREVPQQRAYVSDPTLLGPPPVDPLSLAGGIGGDIWRRLNAAAYTDRREVPQQPPRLTLYFDQGPGTAPLTLAWGAGGSYWHSYRWRREARSWWQPRPVFLPLGTPCTTLRPAGGTTPEPTTGSTIRPFTGITLDECHV